MEHLPAGSSTATRKRIAVRGGARMEWLEHDTLCIIFAFLDVFDLVRCTVVCKSWSKKINGIRSSRSSYEVSYDMFTTWSYRYLSTESSLSRCRMKTGLLLTGVGDKVMRLWSLDNYKCEEEHYMPDTSPLVDFDFDETKIVGLLGTRVGIWRRNGKRSIFPSREGTFSKGLCMWYIDPEVVTGCEDGIARVFDMYSRTCSYYQDACWPCNMLISK